MASTSLFAFPMDLGVDWKVTKGAVVHDTGKEEWIKLEQLPLSPEVLSKLYPSDDIFRTVTLRKDFILDEKDFRKIDADTLSTHFPNLSNAYRIYFNGRLIDSRGEFKDDQITFNGGKRHVVSSVPNSIVRLGGNDIRIVLYAGPGDELDAYGTLEDTYPVLDLLSNNLHITSERINLMLMFLYFCIGLYHLVFFIKRSQEKYNLHFALFSLVYALYMFTRSNTIYELGLDALIQTRIEFILVFHATLYFLTFLYSFFDNKVGLPAWIYGAWVWLLSIIVLFASGRYPPLILMIWQFSALGFAGVSLFVMIRALVRGRVDSKRLFFGFLALFSTALLDLVGGLRITPLDNYGLARYGFLGFELGIVVILANRFLRVHKQVEELNEDLDQKVKDRTAQLQTTLSEVQELKKQQDGDYFLTSLLLDPLSTNEWSNESIKVEGIIRQRKQFEFKHWNKEIGGDINMVDEIILGTRKYLVVANGDAMGKSIQGAGGALVLGVVFRSYIARTKISEIYNKLPPEVWLKECFSELQSIFESFDGSMLVSLVMGLIDLESGIFYFLNAEHPWTALYRKNEASFIEDKLALRKLGITGLRSSMRIRMFLFEKGDSVFIGSDGRDDLLLSLDTQSGKRKINEDEVEFLRRIQESNGDLAELLRRIQSFGELTDDLSLMKITYLREPLRLTLDSSNGFPDSIYTDLTKNKNWIRALEYLENHSEKSKRQPSSIYLKERARVLYKTRNYGAAMELLNPLIESHPEDLEIMYFASLIHMRSKRYEESTQLAERIVLREPRFLNNLLNFATCLIHLGKMDQARKILNRAYRLDSKNEVGKRLRTILEMPNGAE